MQLAICWSLLVDELEELQPFLMAMTWLALSNDGAIGHIERCKESSCAVTHIVMGHRVSPALLQRQAWLGAIQRLDLALLIATQHQRVLRCAQVEPDNVFQLL